MKIKVGDRVALIDGTEKGVVVSIESTCAKVLLDNGLEIPVLFSGLVVYSDTKYQSSLLTQSIEENDRTEHSKDSFNWNTQKYIIKKVIDKDFQVPREKLINEKHQKIKSELNEAWEIDLHIQELVEDYKHLSNGEILEIQLHHFRRFLHHAFSKRIRKLIVIHGVGTGRLKGEIGVILSGYTNLEYYDASYKIYGKGATEVRIYYGKF